MLQYTLTLEFGEEQAADVLRMLADRAPTVRLVEVTRKVVPGLGQVEVTVRPPYQPPRPMGRTNHGRTKIAFGEEPPSQGALSESDEIDLYNLRKSHFAEPLSFPDLKDGQWVKVLKDGRERRGRIHGKHSVTIGEPTYPMYRVLLPDGNMVVHRKMDEVLPVSPSVTDWSAWRRSTFAGKFQGDQT